MSKDTQTAIIYERISSDAQAEGGGLDSRITECRTYCEHKGYDIAGVYQEVYTSEFADRPEFEAMIEQLVRESVNVVVSWDTKRLIGRGDKREQALVAYQILDEGARIEWAYNGVVFDPDDIREDVDAWMSRRENRDRVRYTMAGKRRRLAQGYPLINGGRVPFGYDYISERRRGELVINDAEAAIVREMYR